MFAEDPSLTIEDTDATTPEFLYEQEGVRVQGRIVSSEEETENTGHVRFQLQILVAGVARAVRDGVAGILEHTWLAEEDGNWVRRTEIQEKFSVDGFVAPKALDQVREWVFRKLEVPMLDPDTVLEPIDATVGDQAAK